MLLSAVSAIPCSMLSSNAGEDSDNTTSPATASLAPQANSWRPPVEGKSSEWHLQPMSVEYGGIEAARYSVQERPDAS